MQFDLACRDLVRVRGRLWRVRAVSRFEDCAELDLAAADRPAGAPPEGLIVLAPFDRPVRITGEARPVVVSRRAWMRSLRESLIHDGGPAAFLATARARLDLLPYQLEPAIEVLCRGTTRLLLADAVGLGKTVQAGIILAELRDRFELERALILTPPGLRDQWAAELRCRFDLDSTIADAAWLRAMRAEWPASLNPWSIPGLLITSIDFLKRPEVRPSLAGLAWDVVVIDEAHLASIDSDRRGAAHLCACQARRVLLLTATPHGGDQAAFNALGRIGAIDNDEPLTLFRRSRADAGLASTRRVHLLRIRCGGAETAVHRALREYVRAVWARPAGDDGRLAMIVLVKRSLSGMAPLARSLEARLASLGDRGAPTERQLSLPWAGDIDRADEPPAQALSAPGLADAAEERAWIERLIRITRAAEAGDSKRGAVRRLLRRIGEPVIVFTEYRDTAEALAEGLSEIGPVAVLHGGLDPRERSEIVGRFTRGSIRVLLATDAAGVGLNLQRCCRIVVNLELPWNPMRLEQRVGRVDRIGQSGTVHAINLLGRETAEGVVLARLARRLERARAAVGSIEGVLGWSDQAIAGRWLGIDADAAGEPGSLKASRHPAPLRAVPDVRIERPNRSGDATALVADLQRKRALIEATTRRPARTRPCREETAATGFVPVSAVSGSRMPEPFRAGGVLAIVRVDGRLVPVFAECRVPRHRRRADLRAAADTFLRMHGSRVLAAARDHDGRPGDRSGNRNRAGLARLVERDRRLARLALIRTGPVQPGLFDRHGLQEQGTRRLSRASAELRSDASRQPSVALLLFILSSARRS